MGAHGARDPRRALPLTYDDERTKANLFATLGPMRPAASCSPAIPMSCRSKASAGTPIPFRAEIEDERIYGRGAADMKGFVATALALAPEFVANGLSQPLHFALSYDEEIGCIGVRRLIADLANAGIKPDAVLVGEPTGMRVVDRPQGQTRLPLHRARSLAVTRPTRRRA